MSKAAGRRGPEMRQQIALRPQEIGVKVVKSKKAPSSEHISGRRKKWLSLRETVDNRGNDTGKRSGQPWWKSPLMKAERRQKWA